MKYAKSIRCIKLLKPKGCESCDYHQTGIGYCPDVIRPDAEFAVIAREPGTREIETGEPMTGPAGFVLDKWVLPSAGLSGIPYSKANVLRCHPPGDEYPKSKPRRAAEEGCRQYDALRVQDFDYILVTLNPNSVMRNKYDTLPCLVRDFERVKFLHDQGQKVLVLMGTEAMEMYAPWLVGGVDAWRGHYQRGVSGVENEYVKFMPTITTKMEDFFDAPTVSFDLEWNPKNHQISLISLATSRLAGCWQWGSFDPDLLRTVFKRAGRNIGFNILGYESDLYTLASNGMELLSSGAKFGDLMLAFHILWPQFAGKGFLDLWTCCSLHTFIPNWKMCRGTYCHGPCPTHDVVGYNTLDSHQACLAWEAMLPELMLRRIL